MGMTVINVYDFNDDGQDIRYFSFCCFVIDGTIYLPNVNGTTSWPLFINNLYE